MYSFGKRSLRNLIGVHPNISFFAQRMIERTKYDFSVFEGVRSLAKQRSHFKRGVTHTMDSYHLYGLAVDLVPYYKGRNVWDGDYANEAFHHLIELGDEIAREYKIKVINGYRIWGWDKPHWQLERIAGEKSKKVYDIRKLIDVSKLKGKK